MRIFSALILVALTSCTLRPPKEPPCPVKQERCRCGQLMSRIRSQGTPHQKAGLEDTSQMITSKGISSSRLFLKMDDGVVWMMGGSRDLLNAKLKYRPGETAPIVLSLTAGDVRQIDVGSSGPGEEWHLAVSDKIPVTLAIKAEGGERNLKLNDVLLVGFFVEAMDGTTLSSLGGDQPFLADLDVSHDRGAIGLDLSGNYPVLTQTSLYTAHGDIAGKLTGYYPRLDHVNITAVEGNVELDLTGAWKRPVHMRVSATCGDCILCLPCGLGASIRVHKGRCGRVCIPGMSRKWSNDAYVNEAFGKTEAFLDIEVYITEGTLHVIQDASASHLCCY